MTSSVYLIIMLSVIGVITAVAVPMLMWRKCPSCRRRNSLESATCKYCGAPFPDEDDAK